MKGQLVADFADALFRLLYVAGKVVFCAYLALAALDVGRGLAAAALNYSISQRFALIGMGRGSNAIVFDTATGEVTFRPLPAPESLD
ncbi:MAG: hypothetical protein ACRDZ4_20945 [Egibacteraceae bacterium]